MEDLVPIPSQGRTFAETRRLRLTDREPRRPAAARHRRLVPAGDRDRRCRRDGLGSARAPLVRAPDAHRRCRAVRRRSQRSSSSPGAAAVATLGGRPALVADGRAAAGGSRWRASGSTSTAISARRGSQDSTPTSRPPAAAESLPGPELPDPPADPGADAVAAAGVQHRSARAREQHDLLAGDRARPNEARGPIRGVP